MNITLRPPTEHDASTVTALLNALTAAGSDTDGFWNGADTFRLPRSRTRARSARRLCAVCPICDV